VERSANAELSVSSPHLNFVVPATFARGINDYAAEVKRRHPERFGAYAILPLPDIAASVAELDHALDQLGLDGIALPTHTEGRYLGDAALAPLLATRPRPSQRQRSGVADEQRASAALR